MAEAIERWGNNNSFSDAQNHEQRQNYQDLWQIIEPLTGPKSDANLSEALGLLSADLPLKTNYTLFVSYLLKTTLNDANSEEVNALSVEFNKFTEDKMATEILSQTVDVLQEEYPESVVNRISSLANKKLELLQLQRFASFVILNTKPINKEDQI